jgi:hypothetical protein
MIVAGLEAGEVRSRAWAYKYRALQDPSVGDPAFWHFDPDTGPPVVHWEQSHVRRQNGGHDGKGYVAYQVEVAQENIDALIAAWKARSEPIPIPAPMLEQLPRRGTTERWVYDYMSNNPPPVSDRKEKKYSGKVCKLCPSKVEKKTIQNLVGKYRARFEVS